VRYVVKVDKYNKKVGFWRGKVKKLLLTGCECSKPLT
jgi:hypothetical protein